jgi:hypothetical protein
MAADTDEETSELVRLRIQREELSRELVRKSYRIGELEENIVENARTYEESLSWRVTKPLRAVRKLLSWLRR